MKKFLVGAVFLSILCLIGSPVMADMLIGDIDTTDLTMFSPYWEGNDTNPDFLKNNSEAAEENWLEALLGLEYDSPEVNFVYKEEREIYPIGETSIANYSPGFAWQYAIVKIGNAGGNDDHFAYFDEEGDGLLNTSVFARGVSHVSFFNSVPVPEPTSGLLLGFAILGLMGLKWKNNK